MDLTPFVDSLRQEFAVAADAAGDHARELAERLTAPLVSAVRLTLLTALSEAAEEITRELAPASVDVRLRGRDAEFVVTKPAMAPIDESADEPVPAGPVPPVAPVDEDGAMTRLNLRLSENLKARIEEAAGNEGMSANAWLVRAATAALTPDQRPPARSRGRKGQRYTGWVS
jgi:HicB family